jgi:hypothetical protein
MMASREAAVDGWCAAQPQQAATAHTKAWLIKAAMHLLSALAIDASSVCLGADLRGQNVVGWAYRVFDVV